MATYLCCNINNSVKSFVAKNVSEAGKSYLRIVGGYFPITTSTGTGIKVKNGNSTYKLVETKTSTSLYTRTRQVVRSSTQTGQSVFTVWYTYSITPATKSSTVSFGRESINNGWRVGINSFSGLITAYRVYNERGWVGINGYNNSLQSYSDYSWGTSWGVNQHAQYAGVNYAAYTASLIITLTDHYYVINNSTRSDRYFDRTMYTSNIGACEVASGRRIASTTSRNTQGSRDYFTYVLTFLHERTLNTFTTKTQSKSTSSLKTWTAAENYTGIDTITVSY